MSFLNPEYFWLFAFLLAAFIKNDFRDLRITSYGYILTFVLIVLALTRPVIEQEPIKTQELLSDVVIGVDLSFSMQANDMKPSRLEYAKQLLKELTQKEKKSRFAVLGFTTNAIILSPLTQDNQLLLHLFNSLDEKLIMTRGSDVMSALKLARKMSQSKKVSVVLLSDGADELNYSDEAKFAKENDMVVNVLMIATRQGGTLTLKNGELLKDELGDIVVTRENENIRQIVDATGGVYTKSLDEMRDALEAQHQKDFMGTTTLTQNIELFYYFVFLAIVVFLVSITSLKKYVVAFLLLFGIHLQAATLDFMKNENILHFQNATTLYEEGRYEKALQEFQSVRSASAQQKAVVFYNIGNTLVRLKEFEKAREAYLKSLTLHYTKEADENLHYIKDVKEQEQMSTGEQKSAKKSDLAKKRESSAKKKSGGGSNMKVKANASDGASDDGKKAKAQMKIDLNGAKTKLSSKQYELINARSVREKKPW